MSWQAELDELKRREAFAEKLGGEMRVQRQKDGGRYTVRERIELLADDGSFHEIGKIAGMAEAVKVALIRDGAFFNWLEANADALAEFDPQAMRYMIRRCAELHLRHIGTGGDPFEQGSARPLDYGHWSAHKLEGLSNHDLRHGEAVAIGTLAEARMAEQIGLAQPGLAEQISALLETAGLPSHIPPGLDREKIIAAMQHDKKKADGIVRFALPAAIGDVHVGVEVSNWETVIRGQ